MPAVWALRIEDPRTGYTTVRTYSTKLLRDVEFVALSALPLILRCLDF
jgi:hypothetical protein